MNMKINVINKMDNVGVVIEQGHRIPFGHKIALDEIRAGETVIKYGSSIGMAKEDIAEGQWVHTDDLKTCLHRWPDSEIVYKGNESVYMEKHKNATRQTFMGYRRSNGKTGIRNEIWIIPTVGCINKTAEAIARLAEKLVEGNDYIDGVVCFSHPGGCSRLEEDTKMTGDILTRMSTHPNAGGVLIIGLGCEHNTVETILDKIEDRECVRSMVCQECFDEKEEATHLLKELIEHASEFRRTERPICELTIGVKCGGSDGLSGITANPLVGRISDRVVAAGGTVIMSEVPEMFGAEHLLYQRCKDREVFEKMRCMIKKMRSYYLDNGAPVSENPSPGNKAGGITTLEEKSLGCVQKCGSGEICFVGEYGSSAGEKGINVIYGPGNDLVSTTAIIAAGAQIVLFTTGRGTPMGGVAPTIKISSNSELYNKKKDRWIDIDAGICLTENNKKKCEDILWEFIIDIASGDRKTLSEINGNREFAILQTGVIL